MITVGGTDQLGGYPDSITGALHTALEYVCHVQRIGNAANVLVLPLVGETRGASRDFQFRDLRQHVQQGLGQAVRKILVVLAARHVFERQHGDRCFVGRDGDLYGR